MNQKHENKLNEDDINNILQRIKNNIHPFRDMNYSEVEEALNSASKINTADELSNIFIKLAQKYEVEADRHSKEEETQKEIELLRVAMKYYYIARWPFPKSDLQKEAYGSLKNLFEYIGKKEGKNFEVLNIPYNSSSIKAYLRRPNSDKSPPVMIHWGGIDSWKEDLNQLAQLYLSKGIASIVLDIPGTGDSPEAASISGDKIFSTVIDYIHTRKDLDHNKIMLQGSSWGGYWASKLAYIEKDRIIGSINWGGPIHYFFDPNWQNYALSSKEYLFGAKETVMHIYKEDSYENYLKLNEEMSLINQNVISIESAPMLYVNGAMDSLVPEKEVEIIKDNKSVTIWQNPKGVHMGVCENIEHKQIVQEVIMPWIELIGLK